MIGYVKGILEEVRPDCVILDRDGIGFRIFVPTSLLQGAFSRGQEVKLYTYLSVKEDSLSLYGFAKQLIIGHDTHLPLPTLCFLPSGVIIYVFSS